MTHAARSNLAPARCDLLRRVARIATRVRVETCGYRERNGASCALMARSATLLGTAFAGCVLRMIELDIETCQRRKTFEGWVARVETCVTDRAHSGFLHGDKLLQMTIGASLVAGQTRLRRIVRASEAGSAFLVAMSVGVVEESREIVGRILRFGRDV